MEALYSYFKAFHLISLVAWFAGLFYIFRLFVYHIETESDEVKSTLEVMEKKLIKVIMNPAMIATWFFGIALLMTPVGKVVASQGWFHVKLLCVFLLSGYHGYSGKIRKQLAAGDCKLTSKKARMINEIPTVFLIIIALMVMVRPF